MFWPFKRRKAHADTIVSDTDTQAAPHSPAASRPGRSAFSFSSIEAERDEPQPQQQVAEVTTHNNQAADTDVSVPVVAQDKSIESAVRSRIEQTRSVSVAALGVRPIFVPSFREDATRARLRAETLADSFPAEAVEAWKEYLVFCPRDAAAWFAFGDAWMRCENATMALAAFEKVVELDRQNALAFGLIGHIRHFLGQLEDAIVAYERAHLLQPNCPDMMKELLGLYELTSRSSRAEVLRSRLQAADVKESG
ncbi:MAG: tetratricopeptide repeat protein [Bradymonadia bacterium]